MLSLTRKTALFIQALPHSRIDAVVRADHRAGHRWVHALHFRPEARLNDYYPDGGDVMIYRWSKV